MHVTKSYWFILLITVLSFWMLGVLRFDHQWAEMMFKVLLFPFGYLYLVYESYAASSFGITHMLNDEVLQMIVFLTAVVGQSLIYYLLFSYVKSTVQHR